MHDASLNLLKKNTLPITKQKGKNFSLFMQQSSELECLQMSSDPDTKAVIETPSLPSPFSPLPLPLPSPTPPLSSTAFLHVSSS